MQDVTQKAQLEDPISSFRLQLLIMTGEHTTMRAIELLPKDMLLNDILYYIYPSLHQSI